MNNSNKNLISKGQPNGCPLLFNAIFIIITCVLPACSKKQASDQSLQKQISYCEQIKKPHYKTFVNQARNIDVSTPVGFKLVKSDIDNNNLAFFVYHGNQDIKRVISFYNRELEILGWEFKDLSTKQEGLFICNKSLKTCVVSVRPKQASGSIICITVTNKLDQC
jgi:hypothetical protein